MNDIQTKIFELLDELRLCCEANGIAYYLQGATALHAYRTGEIHPQAHNAQIALLAEDVSRFLKAMEKCKREDRVLEHWGNNENYPDFSMRYSDKESLCFEIKEMNAFRGKGIYLDIVILRNEADLRRGRLRLENGITLNSGLAYTGADLRKLILKFGVGVFLSLRGKRKYLQSYFKKNIRPCKKTTWQYRSRKDFYSRLHFDGPMSFVNVRGQNFQSFNYLEAYFLCKFGQLWKERKVFLTSPNLIVSSRLCCNDYENLLAQHKWNNRRYARALRLINIIHSRKTGEKIREQQRVTSNIVDVIFLKDRYLPKKKSLIDLYEVGNFEELQDELGVYIAMIEKRGKALYFDAEIFALTLRVLQKYKGEAYANRIRKTVEKYEFCKDSAKEEAF
jgi:hypothetical protein